MASQRKKMFYRLASPPRSPRHSGPGCAVALARISRLSSSSNTKRSPLLTHWPVVLLPCSLDVFEYSLPCSSSRRICSRRAGVPAAFHSISARKRPAVSQSSLTSRACSNAWQSTLSCTAVLANTTPLLPSTRKKLSPSRTQRPVGFLPCALDVRETSLLSAAPRRISSAPPSGFCTAQGKTTAARTASVQRCAGYASSTAFVSVVTPSCQSISSSWLGENLTLTLRMVEL